MSRPVLHGALLGALLCVGGCSGSSDPDTTVLHAGDVAVLKETERYEGAVAGIGVYGTIALVHGCVGLADAPARVIVFPPSTEVEGEDDDLVITITGVKFRVGDSFEGGTRGPGLSSLANYGDLSTQAPKSCRGLKAVQLDELPVGDN